MCFTRLTGVTDDKASRQPNDVQSSRQAPLPPPRPSTIELDYDGDSSSESDEETNRDEDSMRASSMEICSDWVLPTSNRKGNAKSGRSAGHLESSNLFYGEQIRITVTDLYPRLFVIS
ncbi:hypothetical protein TELCIR_07650 [Teladorsagia circumcincta]|uniref:Uncharacterized protein n=1 Tax=Teladorsagia circumcincta TaxID=45464 RepID=A0A2G9UJS8_TELCI|nr:hypothetical protein TELCIR_07650 [Teladorsagia circumcincta]